MPSKIAKPRKPSPVRNLSRTAMTAAKAFKGLKVAATPSKLKGKKATSIKRAVRDYYLG